MKVKFVPQNVEFEIKPGESVMHVAQDHGLYIKSVCKGVPSCAECRCRVVEGEHNVLPPSSEELGLIGTGHFIDRRRLSCQLKCFGDITVDLTEQIKKQNELTEKSKTAAVKDDRVEDARAIRSSSYDDESEHGEGGEAQTSAPHAPSAEGAQEAAAGVPQEQRSGGGQRSQPQGQRQANQGQRPASQGPRQQNQGQRPAQGGRPQSQQQGRPNNQQQNQQRPQNQSAQHKSQQPNQEGGGGGSRKRRRRGGRGGGGGGNGGGGGSAAPRG